MAGESKPSGPNLGGNAFVWVAFAAAVLAYITGRTNLENLRPHADQLSTVPATEQDVDARLWQDPFQTVLKADGSYYGWTGAAGVRIRTTLHPCHPPGAAQEDMHCRSPLGNGDSSAQVIAIIEPGGPYSEDAEFRRRTRYAVLAALDVLGYAPDDSQHIGLFILPAQASTPRHDTGAPPDSGGPQFVPYEFLERGAGAPRLVLLWIDEDALDQNPLERLASVFHALGLRPDDGSRIKILGPQGSGTLLAMARNAPAWATAGFPGLALYDFSATADPAALCRAQHPSGCEAKGDWVSLQFRQAHIRFLRATATDDALARAIGAELVHRGIHPGPANVALISEWDTLYGRTLPETFARCLGAGSSGGLCNESGTDDAINAATDSWLRRYSYLRGLDGQTPDASSAAPRAARPAQSGESATEDAAATSGGALLSETAQGDGQGDYLARLASTLRHRDALLRDHGGDGIRAVGVLGSDLYDKLLVLQAVKAALPRAVFFTTDLDRRLISPTKDLSTANLIVASGLGLTLQQPLQRDIPPFRGSYQTAAFLATLMAACTPEPGPGPSRSNCGGSHQAGTASRWFQRVITYEIGRTRPVRLAYRTDNTPAASSADGCSSRSGQVDVFACGSILPDNLPRQPSRTRLIGLASLEAGAAFALSAFLLRLAVGRKRSFARWLTAILVAGTVAGIHLFDPGLLARIDITLLFQGVSLWPFICIQLLSIAFGVAVIFNMRRNSNENLARLRTRFHMSGVLKDLEDQRRTRPIRLREIMPFGIRRWQVIRGVGPEVQQSPADSVAASATFWVRYVDYARHRAEFVRILFLTLLVLGLAGAVHLIFPWSSPMAGPATSAFYTATALIGGMVTLAVALYVADITLFSRLLVREAFARDSHAPVWPHSAKEEFARLSLRTALPAKDDTQDAFVMTTMTIAYVTERTRCITPFIYYPFILIALSVIARSPVLGPATFDPASITVAAVGLLVAFLSAVALRSAAEDARNETMRNLTMLKWRALAPDSPPELRQRLDLLLDRVAALHEGAFSPLSQQPVVRALLLPLASYGSTLLISVLSTSL